MAAAGVTALAAGMAVAVGAPVAQAEPTTFNPFDANKGFSIVSQGDVSLGNGELEGSVAAFGTIQSTVGNYPIRHEAAGMPDYTVPTIDGKPVRILANEFVGTGGFDLTNEGAPAGTPEAEAVAKLVDTSNISAEQRSDFVRLKNTSNGVLDLKALPWTGYSASDYTTERNSVAAYFPDLDEQVAQTNKCLASMYDSDLVNMVEVKNEHGMAYPEGLVDDRPNVIDYKDVAGLNIKSDRMDGYKPTAQAPLVIRVAPGTTEIGAINVEGWSPGKGEDQELSRFIMLDLSEVTGDVTIDGLTMGAIWAPNANLHYNSGATTNGQWFSRDFTSSGGGELHHHSFQGRLPCGDPGDPGEPAGPKIGTSVAVDGSDEKVLPLTGGTVVDTVAYKNLEAGTEYQLEGELRVAPSGEETGIRAEATFTPDSADGTTEVTFELSAEQAEQYAGQDLVVYEYLYLDGEKVAEHTDPTDQAQTFTVAEEDPVVPGDPAIGTTVAVDCGCGKVLPLTGGTVVDTVRYENLEAGKTYQLKGELRVAPTGEATGITAEKTFTPASADGTTEVTFTLTAAQAEQYAGQDLVVYEYLYLDGELVAEHTDPTDEAQTFSVDEDDTPTGSVGSIDLGSVGVGSLGVGSLGVGSLALGSLGSLGSSGGDSSTGSGGTGSGDSSIGSLPGGSIGTGSDTGSDIDTGSTIDLGSTIISGSLGNSGSTGVGSVDLGSVGVGSLGVGSLALGSLGSSGGDSSTGSGDTGSGDSSIGSLPGGSIGTGSDTGSGSNGSVGSTGSGDTGSLGSLIPVGSTGSVAPSLGSLALPLGSLALAAGSAAAGGSGDSGSANNGSTGSGTSDPNGGSGTPDAPTTGEQGTTESADSGDGNAASGSGTTNSGAGASAPSAKGGRIDAGLGANLQSAAPQVAAGLALLVIAGGVLYTAIRRRE